MRLSRSPLISTGPTYHVVRPATREHFVEERAVHPLDEPVCSGATDLGCALIDLFHGQEQLAGVAVPTAAALATVDREDRADFYAERHIEDTTRAQTSTPTNQNHVDLVNNHDLLRRDLCPLSHADVVDPWADRSALVTKIHVVCARPQAADLALRNATPGDVEQAKRGRLPTG